MTHADLGQPQIHSLLSLTLDEPRESPNISFLRAKKGSLL